MTTGSDFIRSVAIGAEIVLPGDVLPSCIARSYNNIVDADEKIRM